MRYVSTVERVFTSGVRVIYFRHGELVGGFPACFKFFKEVFKLIMVGDDRTRRLGQGDVNVEQ